MLATRPSDDGWHRADPQAFDFCARIQSEIGLDLSIGIEYGQPLNGDDSNLAAGFVEASFEY